MQVRIIGMQIAFKAMGAGVITHGEHIVEGILSEQNPRKNSVWRWNSGDKQKTPRGSSQ